MSWKTQISRHLPCVRFFACPKSPASRGVMQYFDNNYEHLKQLNPTTPLMLRDGPNVFPAIATELEFTTMDVLKFMLATHRFRDPGSDTLSQARIEAAKAYINTDWKLLQRERWAHPGFDPEKPYLSETDPHWRTEKPEVAASLALYLQLKDAMEEQIQTFTSGPDKEYAKAQHALEMCQRVDLWCAGEEEVEAALYHLVKVGEYLNEYEGDLPEFIEEFYPGAPDWE